MTDAERKMKKYTTAIERRLRLPRDVKVRVMSDFISSVQARRESGMTDAEIYAEFGNPKKAARDLNEQMKEFAFRKSPWRFAFLALAAASGIWLLLYRVMLRFEMLLDSLTLSFSPNETASIGIIGGADGPTALFVTGTTVLKSGIDWDVLIMVLILIAGILGYVRLCRCRGK